MVASLPGTGLKTERFQIAKSSRLVDRARKDCGKNYVKFRPPLQSPSSSARLAFRINLHEI